MTGLPCWLSVHFPRANRARFEKIDLNDQAWILDKRRLDCLEVDVFLH